MTCIKKGLSELALNRSRPSIMEVKSALPIPLFRLYLSFIFLRVLNSSFYILLLHLARTICGSCVNDLLSSSLRHAFFLRKKNKLSAPPLGLLRIRPAQFLGGISLDFCFWIMGKKSSVVPGKCLEVAVFSISVKGSFITFLWRLSAVLEFSVPPRGVKPWFELLMQINWLHVKRAAS